MIDTNKFNDEIAMLKDKYWNKVHEREYFKRYKKIETKIKADFVSYVAGEEEIAYLDLGCLFANDYLLVDKAAKYIGLDISTYALLKGKEIYPPAHLVLGDCERLPFSSNSFNRVIASHILEHLDMSKALEELYKVTRPQGKILFILPGTPKPKVLFIAISKFFSLLEMLFDCVKKSETTLKKYQSEYRGIQAKFHMREHKQEPSLKEIIAQLKGWFNIVSVKQWGFPNLFGNLTYNYSFPSKILILLEQTLARLNLNMFNDRYAIVVEKESKRA